MTLVSYAQNFEDVMLWRALRHVACGFYIDVGAFDPSIDSVTRAFYEAGWRGINVEPTRAGYQRLAQQRPRDVNLEVAIGDTDGVAAFYDIAETGLSTLYADQAAIHKNSGLVARRSEVQVMTLAAVCERHAPGPIHFLKLDCEGSERAALAGADFTRFRPWIVVAEATSPNTQEPSYQEWEPLLSNARYEFVWFDGLNRFYVAAEHHDTLVSGFSAPPNVFDNFVRYDRQSMAQPARIRSASLDASAPAPMDEEARILMTARCRDADPVPKVERAGIVQERPDGTLVQFMHNGLQVPAGAYYGDWMTRLITLCAGHHEPQEERLFHEVVSRLPQSATMIELGAYWAYYTAWFLKDAPHRRAVMLEPDPIHRAAGRQTLVFNGLNAAVVAGFVGGTSATAVPFRTEKSGTLLLPRFTVPELMRQHGIETLDLLHCDTQGAELQVLQSCRDLLLAKRIGWVFVSTHARPITGDPLTHQRCLALLRELGAEIEAEHDVLESFSGDGLIVARFGPAPEGWTPVALSYNRYSTSLYPNPAFELAGKLADPPMAAVATSLVQAAYKALFLRPADGEGLRTHAEALAQDGDFLRFLEKMLTCSEFADNLPHFLAAYVSGAPHDPASEPSRTGLPPPTSLVLASDGPLGRRGETVLLPTDRVIGPAVKRDGAWNESHTRFVADRLDRCCSFTLLDIGANVGLFSRQLLNACPQIAGCICVEPDPENFELLERNLAGFGSRPIQLHNLALDVVDGRGTLLRDVENAGNLSLNTDAMRDRPHGAITVPIVATATWMRDHVPGSGPLVWKSDTQGHDQLIVGETPWELWDRIQFAVVELWQLRRTDRAMADFRSRIDCFRYKSLGTDRPTTTDEAMEFLAGSQWGHDDLFLWR